MNQLTLSSYYHGTNQRFEILDVPSWLTMLLGHAICQAKLRVEQRGGIPQIMLVEADENDVREVNESDRNSENIFNDPSHETSVRITMVQLKVLKVYDMPEAERLFKEEAIHEIRS